ncbi:MAG: ABC transporter permease [Clostridia bacterium]|nr:ABC transporter permease [Clostridia bacterium]
MRTILPVTKLDTIRKSSYILNSMVRNSIRSQYRNSILGVLWTVLNPLLNMAVMALVFSKLLGSGISDYPTYLLSGNIIFGLMRQATSTSLTSIVDSFGMLTKVKVPYSVLPLSRTITALVTFAFSFIALVIVMLVRNVKFSFSILMTIPFLPSLLLFSLGIAFILCTLYVYFRDMKHIYGVVLTLWMYMTPLFYTVDRLGNPLLTKLMQFNPMYQYVTYFREIIMMGTVPSLESHLICYAWGIGFFLIGLLFFKWRRKYFILHI